MNFEEGHVYIDKTTRTGEFQVYICTKVYNYDSSVCNAFYVSSTEVFLKHFPFGVFVKKNSLNLGERYEYLGDLKTEFQKDFINMLKRNNHNNLAYMIEYECKERKWGDFTVKCECGAQIANDFHSSWCPLYTEIWNKG